MSSSKAGKAVRISRDEARATAGQTDWKRVDAATDAEIAAWQSEEGLPDEQLDLSSARVVAPQTDVRQLPQELGLSREEFALRYRLSPRTVQHEERLVSPSWQPTGKRDITLKNPDHYANRYEPTVGHLLRPCDISAPGQAERDNHENQPTHQSGDGHGSEQAERCLGRASPVSRRAAHRRYDAWDLYGRASSLA